MKRMKKFLGILLAAVLSFSFAVPAHAALKEYEYTVRVFAGKQGSFGGSTLVEKGEITDGDVTFRQAQESDSNAGYVSLAGTEYPITLPGDSKYYVKGIKISGSETMANSSSAINKDMDYVIVYGVKGDQVGYTVRYLDMNGNTLFDDERYVGNVGDKPIVAYRYLEGYIPNANNLTKTLSRNEAENVFTFYYSRIGTLVGGAEGNVMITEEVVTGVNGVPIVIQGGATAAGEAAGDDGGVLVIPGAAEAGGAAAAGGDDAGAQAVEILPEQVPQDLIDLDEEDVPLANVNLTDEDTKSEPGSFFLKLPPAAIVGIVSAAVLTVAGAWYILFKKKKKNTDGKVKAEKGKEEKRNGK